MFEPSKEAKKYEGCGGECFKCTYKPFHVNGNDCEIAFAFDMGRASRDVDAEVAALKAVTDRDKEIARLNTRVKALGAVAEAARPAVKSWRRYEGKPGGFDAGTITELEDALDALDSETKEAKKK